MASSQKLSISVEAVDKASGKLNKINRSVDDLGSASKRSGMSMAKMGVGIAAATAALAAVGAAAKKVINLAAEQEKAEVRLTAVVKATGGAAGLTSNQLFKMASAFQTATGMGDELVMQGQAILLTFKNIRGDAFERTMKSALDMSAVLGTDLKGSAMQLGKALNDPVKGLTMLTRVGITFTEEQQKVIKALAATGDVAAAQGVILAELESQMGGAAEAMGDTLAGSMEKAKGAVGDLGEEIGFLLSPAVRTLSGRIVTLAEDSGEATKRLVGLIEAANTLELSFWDVWGAGLKLTDNQKQLSAKINVTKDAILNYDEALENCFEDTEDLTVAGGDLAYANETKVSPSFQAVREGAMDVTDAIKELEPAYYRLFDAADRAKKIEDRLISSHQALYTATLEASEVTGKLEEKVVSLGDESDDTEGSIGSLTDEIMKHREEEQELDPVVKRLTDKIAILEDRLYATAHASDVATISGRDLGSSYRDLQGDINNTVTATGNLALAWDGLTSWGGVTGSGYATGTGSGSGAGTRGTGGTGGSGGGSTQTGDLLPGQTSPDVSKGDTGQWGVEYGDQDDGWNEMFGEWQPGAAGRSEEQHLKDVINDMKSRHGFTPDAPQGWAMDFLRTGGGPGSGTGLIGRGFSEDAIATALASAKHGMDMIVPPGFNNDNFTIGTTSGERVTVTPAHMMGGGGGGLTVGTINVYGVQTASQLYEEVVKAARQRGRTFAKVL